MQAVFKGQFPQERYIEQMSGRYPFVNQAFISSVLEQIRKLMGHYRGTGMHQVMTLDVPDDSFHERTFRP